MTAILTLPTPAAHARSWAWGISLLVHGAVLAWLVHALPQRSPRADDPAPEVHFVLVAPRPPAPPPDPVPQPAPRAVPEPASAPSSAPAARARPARTAKPAPADPAPAQPQPIAMPEDHPEPAFTVAPPAASGDGKRFDMAAARSAARAAVAGEGGGADGRGKPLGATRDEKLGRAIDGARNGDCQTQYAGMGLLAVIPLVKDTVTGTGCKWK